MKVKQLNHHDCDEAYKPSTISELAGSQHELDRHALARSLKKVRALRPVIVTKEECSYTSNETEPLCSSSKHSFAVQVNKKSNNRKKRRLVIVRLI